MQMPVSQAIPGIAPSQQGYAPQMVTRSTQRIMSQPSASGFAQPVNLPPRVVQQVMMPAGVVAAPVMPSRENSGFLPGVAMNPVSPVRSVVVMNGHGGTPRLASNPTSPHSANSPVSVRSPTLPVYSGSMKAAMPTGSIPNSQKVVYVSSVSQAQAAPPLVSIAPAQSLPPQTETVPVATAQSLPPPTETVSLAAAQSLPPPTKTAAPANKYVAAVAPKPQTAEPDGAVFKEVVRTFQPGALGVAADYERGEVGQVNAGQCLRHGVQMGWFFHKLDGQPYSEDLLDAKVAGTSAYEVTFLAAA